MQPVVSPCEHKYIPPEETLASWKGELQKAFNLAVGHFYVENDFGRYSLETVNGALQLHKACNMREFVEQEIDWLSETYRLPQSVTRTPEKTLLNNYRSKIHNYSYDMELPKYDITPDELSQVCLKRLLSGDHMWYLAKLLNFQQNDTLCVYENSVKNVKRYVDKRRTTSIKKLAIILHVGKKRLLRNGNAEWSTFVSNGNNRGCHFSVAFVDLSKKDIMYGDSLGWPSPTQLPTLVQQYYSAINDTQIPTSFHLSYYHQPSTDNFAHSCTSCSNNYPLQKDGNICGIVAIIMTAIYCLDYTDHLHLIPLPCQSHEI